MHQIRLALVAVLLCGLSQAALAEGPPQSIAPSFALLTGDQEVPPVETGAVGVAGVVRVGDGRALLFSVVTFGLQDVVQAHIHLGPAGENGPVVAFLFDSVADPVTRDGRLARGRLTANDLVGPLAGQPLSALIDAIGGGNTYVNVHTVEHPGGEIRGQLESVPSFFLRLLSGD